MNRFFVPKEQLPIITGSDAHQIKNVLRLKPGAEIELIDGNGGIYAAIIKHLTKDQVVCEIVSSQDAGIEQKVKVTLLQCLPKAKKMDLIIQKCTELGVAKIVPVLSERSIAKGDKLERWQKIAKEAAEQSGRSTIPEIAPLTKFADALKTKTELKLIPWELEQIVTLKNTLSSLNLRHHPSISVLIGPEGGLSVKEVQLAKDEGFQPVTLGKNILRTETAGLAILSMINYEFEQ